MTRGPEGPPAGLPTRGDGMSRRFLALLVSVGSAASSALAQLTPCAAGAPVNSYSVCPIAAGFGSILAYLATSASMIVEWNNMKFSASGASGGSPGRNGSVTFQAALFPSGTIEFRYGPFTPPDTTACPPYPADSCGAASAFPQSGPTAT